ncbi:MAG: hypothetical protein RLZZ74_3508 [Cyanobacteriota bacterium]
MQNNITLNLLTWDEAKLIPFSDEVKEITAKVVWPDHVWHVTGLPIHQAKYSILGKKLYLDELPDGTAKVEEQNDFTGIIKMASYFVNPELEGNNHFVSFMVTFCRGEVLEVTVDSTNTQPNKEYQTNFKNYNEAIMKVIKRKNSWWYRFLYKPYYHALRVIFFIPLFLIHLADWLLRWFFDLITFPD